MTTNPRDPERLAAEEPPPPAGATPPPPAPPDKLRQRIASEAARALAGGSDARRAVFRAARRVARAWVPPERLPEQQEVRSALARLPDTPLPTSSPRVAGDRIVGDRFDALATLVAPLATVRRNPATHPEGDALEHSLQVFAFVHAERPFDEELLTAALVHDVGLAIDRTDPVAAALAAVGDLITPRTRWLVESLPAAAAYGDLPVTNARRSTLGHRARQRLAAHPDFEDVLLLAEADRRGRIRGGVAPSLDEALAILRSLDASDKTDASNETEPGAVSAADAVHEADILREDHDRDAE